MKICEIILTRLISGIAVARDSICLITIHPQTNHRKAHSLSLHRLLLHHQYLQPFSLPLSRSSSSASPYPSSSRYPLSYFPPSSPPVKSQESRHTSNNILHPEASIHESRTRLRSMRYLLGLPRHQRISASLSEERLCGRRDTRRLSRAL